MSINSRRQVCRVIWDKSLSAPASVYPAAKPVWICSCCAKMSFSLQEHRTWCRDPKDSPAFAQPVAWEQKGCCQIQTLSELEGELVLGAFSDLHVKPQENICHKACDNSSSICSAQPLAKIYSRFGSKHHVLDPPLRSTHFRQTCCSSMLGQCLCGTTVPSTAQCVSE